MDKGWFPNFSVYCVKCNKRRNQVCYNPKTNHVYIHCACPESRSYYNGDLILWKVDSYGMFAVVQKDNTITGKNAVDGPTCPIPLYNCAYGKNTGIFAIETYEKALQQQQQQQPAALQIPEASNNNNSQIDNRRPEETDKRIVALQNEVHKLSNELETQTIMMRDEIGQLKRKLFRNELMCVICQTNQIDAALGCGHVFCSECAQSIQKCAFCRKEVQATEIRKLFL